ncbi:tyrosine-type recombinase/integrase, partial [Escherichia coli]
RKLPDKPLTDISTKEVAAMLNTYVAEGKAASAKLIRSTLVDVFREAIAEGHVATNPVTATRTAKSEVRRSRLTANEYVEIYHAAEPLPIWLRLAMDLAVVTGQRVGDLCRMKWSDINDNHLHIEQSKTGAKLAIPLTLTIDALNISLADTLQKCREASSSETIIASKHHDPLSPKTVSKYFTKARNASGLSFDGNPPTFHELRSLSARLYRNQIGDKFAQRLLGHKSDLMAARYRDSRGREWDKIEIDK